MHRGILCRPTTLQNYTQLHVHIYGMFGEGSSFNISFMIPRRLLGHWGHQL